MKKLIWMPIILVIAFLVIWIIKFNSPIEDTVKKEPAADYVPWWERAGADLSAAPTPDNKYVLDKEIPSNYMPIIGADNLYAVTDENGQIVKYRQRQQTEDGSWIWHDVDPHIPSDYEAVEGLENIYKVTDESGKITYLRYTRNSDDTFYFTEVDENGNDIVDITPKDDTIPPNYIHVGNNIYAVYNEYGVLIGYLERYSTEDGSYAWRTSKAPEIEQETPSGGNSSGSLSGWGEYSTGGGYGGSYYTDPSTGNVGAGGSEITIISGDPTQQDQGYTEKETVTTIERENGMVIVYETIIIRSYDKTGELISTKKEGPTEINRFPETEFNENLLP